LRIDTRKFLLAKLQPKRYGDHLSASLTCANSGPIKTEEVDFPEFRNLSADDLLTMREILLRAARPEGEDGVGDNG
jgi:hypothetical protein